MSATPAPDEARTLCERGFGLVTSSEVEQRNQQARALQGTLLLLAEALDDEMDPRSAALSAAAAEAADLADSLASWILSADDGAVIRRRLLGEDPAGEVQS